MWVETSIGVTVLPVRELEALFDRTSEPLAIEVKEHYPNHRPQAVANRFVRYAFDNYVSLEDTDGGWTSTRIPVVPGLRQGIPITLYDELMKDFYLEYSIDNQPRRPIYDRPFPTDWSGSLEVRVEPAIDPAGQLTKASTAARRDDLDRVFGLLADEPDDEAAGLVINASMYAPSDLASASRRLSS